MNIILSDSEDPYFNLAAEEYLLKSSELDFVFLYVNKPCVVVGKHQISQKEINSSYVYNNNILVARRLSGGGAVFQDEGNLNVSFIRTQSVLENLTYRNISESLYFYLKLLLPDLILTERNDFYLNDKKISGSAMHIYKNRVLAHCTLLVSSDLSHLSASLHNDQSKFEDKSISSKRVSVTNLSYKRTDLALHEIRQGYIEYLISNNIAKGYSNILTEKFVIISNMAFSKYSTTDWIFGYSPKYLYNSFVEIDKTRFEYEFQVEKGIIEKVNLKFDERDHSELFNLLTALTGEKHNIFSLMGINTYTSSPISLTLIQSLFS